MENILFGTTIPNLNGKTLADLTTGQIGLQLFNANERTAPIVRGNEVTNTELLTAKGVQFVKMNADGTFSASLIIPNKTTNNRNYQAYVAGVTGVYKLGDNASAPPSLTFPAAGGEGNIRILDLARYDGIDNFAANLSYTKKVTETDAQYLARVVAGINADPIAKTLVTALLETNTGRYQIKLTTTSYKVKLSVATDGIFAPYQLITVTPRVIAVGTGEQMQKIEKDLTVFKGNGNYTEWTSEYYNATLASSTSTNYNTLSLTWTAIAQPTVSTTMAVATVNLLVAVPAADSTLLDIYNTFITPDVIP